MSKAAVSREKQRLRGKAKRKASQLNGHAGGGPSLGMAQLQRYFALRRHLPPQSVNEVKEG